MGDLSLTGNLKFTSSALSIVVVDFKSLVFQDSTNTSWGGVSNPERSSLRSTQTPTPKIFGRLWYWNDLWPKSGRWYFTGIRINCRTFQDIFGRKRLKIPDFWDSFGASIPLKPASKTEDQPATFLPCFSFLRIFSRLWGDRITITRPLYLPFVYPQKPQREKGRDSLRGFPTLEI